jgi:hypothetical protein
MRLHRHDELVEVMAKALDLDASGLHPDFPESKDYLDTVSYKFRRDMSMKRAAAALDAMLEAVMRLKVGWTYDPMMPSPIPQANPALILKLEPSHETVQAR